MNKYKLLLSNVGLFTLSNFASKFLVFLLLPLYTKTLTTSEYGNIDIITNTIYLIMPILTLTISESIIRFSIDEKINKTNVLLSGISVVLLSFIILLSFVPFFLMFHNSISQHIVYFLVIYLTQSIALIFSQFMRGIGKVKIFAINGVLITLVTIISNIIFLIILKMGINGYLLSICLSNVVSCLYLFFIGRLHEYSKLFSLDFSLIKSMIRYSVPIIPATISWWINNVSDRYIVTAVCGSAINGLYSIAYKIPTMLTIFTSIFMQAWQISAIKEYDKNDYADFYSQIYKYYNILITIICSILILSCRFFARYLFLDNFYSAWIYVPFLLIAFVFAGLASVLSAIFLAEKKTNMLFVSTTTGAVINIMLNLTFVWKYGAMGSAVATFVSFLFVWVVRIFNSKKIITINMFIKKSLMGYIILFTQAIIVIINFKYSYIAETVLFLLLLILFYTDLKNILNKSVRVIKTVIYNT